MKACHRTPGINQALSLPYQSREHERVVGPMAESEFNCYVQIRARRDWQKWKKDPKSEYRWLSKSAKGVDWNAPDSHVVEVAAEIVRDNRKFFGLYLDEGEVLNLVFRARDHAAAAHRRTTYRGATRRRSS